VETKLDAASELDEVLLLRRPQRMPAKEWDHGAEKLRAPAHDIPIQVLAVVVMPTVRNDLTHPEEAPELVQAGNALRALRHDELVSDLVAGPVAVPPRSGRLPNEAD
jgi:hypothetical protein